MSLSKQRRRPLARPAPINCSRLGASLLLLLLVLLPLPLPLPQPLFACLKWHRLAPQPAPDSSREPPRARPTTPLAGAGLRQRRARRSSSLRTDQIAETPGGCKLSLASSSGASQSSQLESSALGRRASREAIHFCLWPPLSARCQFVCSACSVCSIARRLHGGVSLSLRPSWSSSRGGLVSFRFARARQWQQPLGVA